MSTTQRITPLLISILTMAILYCNLSRADDVTKSPNQPQAKDQPKAGKLSDDELDDLFLQAVMLTKFGFYDEAAQRCKQILAQVPDQPTAQNLLREIEQKSRQAHKPAASAALKARLEQTIIPEVNFRGAKASDVIDFLRKESAKLSSDKAPINFVWTVPDESKVREVTLSLKKIPLIDVIQYTSEQAGLHYRIDSNAVVFYQDSLPISSP